MNSLRGNTFEGHTLIPVLDKFQKRFNLNKPVIVADSGLLSRANIEQLIELDYQYIIGARIKNESQTIKDFILNLKLCEDGKSASIDKGANQRLIITYSDKRARKDAYNRQT